MPEDLSTWPIGRLLSTASRQVENRWQEALAAHGITHAGVIVLHLLSDGAKSQSELATLAKVEDQTISRTIERLERSALVSRERDPADGRRLIVSRTPAGAAAFDATRTIEADLFPPIEDEEAFRSQLVRIIRSHGR
ncbi:MarR family winged helix-turn-helix transcriptional regulator [uncultured Amnibacterium sp.]|uniref:MarR family winged helix-turn-helix transcriptional regulator n=1 Tax=uncultured Amnibacterium sp. TaxID=1631851 RepID=UPI0035CB5DC0